MLIVDDFACLPRNIIRCNSNSEYKNVWFQMPVGDQPLTQLHVPISYETNSKCCILFEYYTYLDKFYIYEGNLLSSYSNGQTSQCDLRHNAHEMMCEVEEKETIARIRSRACVIMQELVANAWHPRRMRTWCLPFDDDFATCE